MFTIREQMMALNAALTPNGTSLGELMTIKADIIVLKKALQKAIRKGKDVEERVMQGISNIKPVYDEHDQ